MVKVKVISEDEILVESLSRPGLIHTVRPQEPSCTCEAWTYGGRCSKHFQIAAKALSMKGMMGEGEPSRDEGAIEELPPAQAMYEAPSMAGMKDKLPEDLPLVVTSRWGNKGLADTGYAPVRISVGQPRFAVPYVVAGYIKELAPEYAWLKMGPEEYDRRFFGKLESIGVRRIGQRLKDTSVQNNGAPLVLLCFEHQFGPKASSCHRRGFAEWWKEKTGIEIPEINEETGELVWTSFRGARDGEGGGLF